MRAYPIWNNITACIYKGDKSYGIKNTGEVEILVGTSASNSHPFLNHTTTHRKLEDGSREYRFYIDGEIVKRAILPKDGEELQMVATL